ncbi:hypothetical protein B0A55_09437 [Friedmanniomyces simplex]|uniref:CN hydrolase domain-containing protein n=1 Tax=Friedmanniomyces simplex TaxID=329884 RepID=A0A4U0WQH3_9PEZI|nr:hypothetical protein B0A55_09437 [Friedmanniomyces simplex]
MRTVGNEGRCFVLSAISCVKRKHLPNWVTVSRDSSMAEEKPKIDRGPTSPNRSPHAARRRSSIIVREDRHELVLPAMEESSFEDATSAIAADADLGVHKTHSSAPTHSTSDQSDEDFVCRGGSCIVGPMGNVVVEPLWEVEDGGLLVCEADFEDCERGRLDLDVAGSYSRNDAFRLTVEGLEITPPP